MSRSNIVIRRAKPEDAEAIQHIIYQGWSNSGDYKTIFQKDRDKRIDIISTERIQKRKESIIDTTGEIITMIAEEIHTHTIIVGICNGRGNFETKVGIDLGYDTSEYGELKVLYVSPKIQNQGIGGLLLKSFEKRVYANDRKGVILETLQENRQSNSFYQKQGYQDTGKTCDFTRRNTTTMCKIYIKIF